MRGKALPTIAAGSIIGRLMVIEPATQLRERGKRYGYSCRCECGRIVFAQAFDLRNGRSKMCRECADANRGHQAVTHGMSGAPGYSNWRQMTRRCREDPHYAGRVSVCERWLGVDGPKHFFADLGPRPSPKHSLDRFPNRDGNYEPGNVRWATAAEQNRNKDSNVMLTVDGVTLTLGEWAEKFGIDRQTLWARHKLGMDDKTAVTMPVRAQIMSLTIDGVTCTLERWAHRFGVDAAAITHRLENGCAHELAVLAAGQTVAIDSAGRPSAVIVTDEVPAEASSRQDSFIAKNGYPITIDGETRSQSEWARIGGVTIGTIRRRLNEGLDPESAVFKRPDQGHALDGRMRNQDRADCVKLTVNGETKIVSAWARDTGLSENCIRNRLAQGWNHRRAVTTPSQKRSRRVERSR